MKNIKQIREAVLLHHGGFDSATDGQIKTIWNSLSTDDQIRYFNDLKEKGKGDADRTGSKPNV